MKIQEALDELRKQEPRKFEQSVDLIINLKGIDAKKDQVNFITTIPHKIKEKNVCGAHSAILIILLCSLTRLHHLWLTRIGNQLFQGFIEIDDW